jgi:Carboxypeptidase regulatory-like domain
VNLTGASAASTTADSGGNYTFSGLANGSYTVTPSKTGYVYTPASQAVTVNGANVSAVNFGSTTAPTYSISGTISGVGGPAATVKLTGTGSASTTADSGGNYTFSGFANGSYTVTPSKTGYIYTPPSKAVTVNGANVSAVNFSSAGQTYSISGTISGAGGPGATVNLTGALTASTTADSGGNYTFSGLVNGSYTVTPSKTGYIYTPPSKAVTVNGANVSAVNFTSAVVSHWVGLSWTASTSQVVGYNAYRSTTSNGTYTKLNSVLVTSTTYSDQNVQSGLSYYYVTTAVDSQGNESVYSNQAVATVP